MKKKIYTPFLVWIAMLMAMFLFDKIITILFKFKFSYQVFLQDLFLFLIFYTCNKLFLHTPFKKRLKQNIFNLFKINLVPLMLSIILIIAVSLATKLHFSILSSFIIAISAAIFEEFFFRGLLLNMILNLFTTNTHNSLIISILLTNLLFGLSHLGNLSFQSLSGTLVQILSTFSLGMLLAAIYLRTGSLIYPILFHFILDFSVILIKGVVTASPTTHSLVSSIIMNFIYILSALLLLRKSKTVYLTNSNHSY